MAEPQTFAITAPNGQSLEITGDRIPTEAELHDIFKAAGVETGATFSSTNEKDAQGNAVLAPNTVGTLASHFWDQANPVGLGQMLPFPQAAGGAGWSAPWQAAKALFGGHPEVLQEAKDAYDKGDLVGAAGHFLGYLTMGPGKVLDEAGNRFRRGEYMAGLGDTLGLATALFGVDAVRVAMAAPNAPAIPGVLPRGREPNMGGTTDRSPGRLPVNPEDAAAVQFGERAGIPIDAGTRTGNKFVQSAQAVADRSLIGSRIADTARQGTREALDRTGEQLAARTREGAPLSAEDAGAAVRDALESKVAAHEALADHAYDAMREREADPSYSMAVPRKPTAVDGLSDTTRGQLRRIVHEIDALPKVDRTWDWREGANGVRGNAAGGHADIVPGAGGASVFHDIADRLGYAPTRSVVLDHLENYLGGGPETTIVKATLEVAEERNKGRGGSTVTKPELPPSAMDLPTRRESTAGTPTVEEMRWPVALKPVKEALRPLFAQLERQLPLTQRQASAGFHALEQLLAGEDYAPLSQVDRDLSAIKTLAREGGGVAKVAVYHLDKAVQQAAEMGGIEALQTLKQGRAATAAKYATREVLEGAAGVPGLPAEPVKLYQKLLSPKDGAIEQLRTVVEHAPQTAPTLARAYLEQALALKPDAAAAHWNKLGPSTRALLYPENGLATSIGQFFRLQQMLAKDVNPSGSGHHGIAGAQMAAGGYALAELGHLNVWPSVAFVASQAGLAGVAKLLRSPAGVRALTRGIQVDALTPPATPTVRAAALAQIANAARAADVPLTLPKAAKRPSTPGESTQP